MRTLHHDSREWRVSLVVSLPGTTASQIFKYMLYEERADGSEEKSPKNTNAKKQTKLHWLVVQSKHTQTRSVHLDEPEIRVNEQGQPFQDGQRPHDQRVERRDSEGEHL